MTTDINEDLGMFNLDDTLDDIEDLPDFLTNVPTGLYKLYVTDCGTQTFEATEERPAKTVLYFRYKIAETVSLEKMNAVPVPDGSMFSENFGLADKTGKQLMKLRFKGLLGKIEGIRTSELVELVKTFYNPDGDGNTFTARLRTKMSSKDGKNYENIQMTNIEKSENIED